MGPIPTFHEGYRLLQTRTEIQSDVEFNCVFELVFDDCLRREVCFFFLRTAYASTTRTHARAKPSEARRASSAKRPVENRVFDGNRGGGRRRRERGPGRSGGISGFYPPVSRRPTFPAPCFSFKRAPVSMSALRVSARGYSPHTLASMDQGRIALSFRRVVLSASETLVTGIRFSRPSSF